MAGYIAEKYNYYFFELSDPRTNGLILLDSPIPFALIIVSYISFVKWFGPRWMKDRPPLNVDKVMLLHNMIQMAINADFVYMAMTKLWIPQRYGLICMKVKNEPDRFDLVVTKYAHLFLISRLLDFFDTVFMILRKKDHQASFLHIYHHLVVAIVGWYAVKYHSGGNLIFFGTVNSFVHMFMYFYYFLTTYDPSYKKSIWLKKQITQIQLGQFVIVFLQQLLAVFSEDCLYPKYVLVFIASQLVVMMYLFSKFYFNTYEKKKLDHKNS